MTINGSGTITGLSAGGLPANSVTAATCNFSPGKILQVVQTKKTDTQYWENISEGDFGGAVCSTDITPSSANNFILIQANLSASTNSTHDLRTQIFKGGSVLSTATGNADSSKTRVTSTVNRGGEPGSATLTCLHLDPCTGWTSGALTYDIRLGHWDNADKSIGLNHTWNWDSNNAAWVARAASHLILMEVAA